MATTAKRKSGAEPESKAEPKRAPKAEPAADEPAAPVCTVAFCPLCLAVTAVQPMKPEAIEHLLLAGREFLLAAKSILDARAGGPGEAGDKNRSTLEKIDIE